eukprot:6952869-Prymnesium_polylepis.1
MSDALIIQAWARNRSSELTSRSGFFCKLHELLRYNRVGEHKPDGSTWQRSARVATRSRVHSVTNAVSRSPEQLSARGSRL